MIPGINKKASPARVRIKRAKPFAVSPLYTCPRPGRKDEQTPAINRFFCSGTGTEYPGYPAGVFPSIRAPHPLQNRGNSSFDTLPQWGQISCMLVFSKEMDPWRVKTCRSGRHRCAYAAGNPLEKSNTVFVYRWETRPGNRMEGCLRKDRHDAFCK